MSDDFLPTKPILFEELTSLKGEVYVVEDPTLSANEVVLTDGRDHLCAYRTRNGFALFTVYGANEPWLIMKHLCDRFGVKFVSEYNEEEFDRLAKDNGCVKVSVSIADLQDIRKLKQVVEEPNEGNRDSDRTEIEEGR